MYRGPGKYFKVVQGPEQKHAIWLAEAPILHSWQETGLYGSEQECWDYVETCEEDQGYLIRIPDHV